MSETTASPAATDRNYLAGLWWLGLVSGLVYLAIAWLSVGFHYDAPPGERPILVVLALFGAALACYFVAIHCALRAPQDRRLLWAIAVPAILFRATLIPSLPIQEIDIYRYLWDGVATSHGISPFRYSPKQVLDASPRQPLPGDLRRLVELRDRSPTTATIVSRIDWGYLPTVYPPVSQAVFAIATLATPDDAPVWLRMAIMKTFFVLCDLGTLLVVIYLLRRFGRHVGWSVAYAWCPLVMKEFANSGHVDAVAVFLTTLALAIAARALFPTRDEHRRRSVVLTTTLAAAVLALAVGAKLYPVVLVPLLTISVWRRLGFRAVAASGAAFTLITIAILWPMLPSKQRDTPPLPGTIVAAGELPPLPGTTGVVELPPLPDARNVTDSQDPSTGLATFLRSWEMNDFMFMLVVENLKPQADTPPHKLPWFDLVPDRWTTPLLRPVARWQGVDLGSAAFLVTRALTSALFLGIALMLAWRDDARDDATGWLRAAFLTLAWFWLLSPTQNPWYWIWALPLVPFARGRAWLALSGLLFLYYLRFWLEAHWVDETLLLTRYRGEYFFHFVLVWFEYVPWFAWLALATAMRRKPGPWQVAS